MYFMGRFATHPGAQICTPLHFGGHLRDDIAPGSGIRPQIRRANQNQGISKG